jgi:hypothetical protein
MLRIIKPRKGGMSMHEIEAGNIFPVRGCENCCLSATEMPPLRGFQSVYSLATDMSPLRGCEHLKINYSDHSIPI